MLLAAGIAKDREDALNRVRDVWQSGQGLQRFVRMVEAQGGDIEAGRRAYADVPRLAVTAPADGVITGVHARAIGLAGIVLGVGRVQSGDTIDYAAGMVFHKTTGDEVRRGEEIGYIQGYRTDKFPEVLDMVHRAIGTGSEAPPEEVYVLGELV